uniref:Uncharacterized protein n=1 Tax=Pyrococcus abyssi (strain GE5 / Orsay) TaxID=272844 RepID=G8ZJZ8_PYRAB|nr:hypothetical protein [Pyrococcus abyssi]CCE71105.1 TPA: hypothetical protein PAB1080.1n [Pyrococcus abyssi GE5]
MDRYANALAMLVSHYFYVGDMRKADFIFLVVERGKPDARILEIEAISLNTPFEF